MVVLAGHDPCGTAKWKTFPYPQELSLDSTVMDQAFVMYMKNSLSVFPSTLCINVPFELSLSVQNKALGILKQPGFPDVHTLALFWVRKSLCLYSVLKGEPSW